MEQAVNHREFRIERARNLGWVGTWRRLLHDDDEDEDGIIIGGLLFLRILLVWGRGLFLFGRGGKV